jgi:hypothetical protein
MSITNHKLWLLQNEKALQSIVKHPERTLHSVAKMYEINFDDLSEFLEKFCPDGVQLTDAGLHGIKIELGIISSSGRPPAAGERPPPQQITQTGIAPDRLPEPWLVRGRRPQARALVNYRARLEAMAEGQPRADHEVAWMAFLRKWLGNSNAPAAQVKLFLAWIDAGESSATDESSVRVAKPRKVKAARVPRQKKPRKAKAAKKPKRKYTRQAAPTVTGSVAGVPFPSEASTSLNQPAAVAVVSRTTMAPPPFSFSILGYQLIIQRRPKATADSVASDAQLEGVSS